MQMTSGFSALVQFIKSTLMAWWYAWCRIWCSVLIKCGWGKCNSANGSRPENAPSPPTKTIAQTTEKKKRGNVACICLLIRACEFKPVCPANRNKNSCRIWSSAPYIPVLEQMFVLSFFCLQEDVNVCSQTATSILWHVISHNLSISSYPRNLDQNLQNSNAKQLGSWGYPTSEVACGNTWQGSQW